MKEILIYPDPFLRETAKVIVSVNRHTSEEVRIMRETLDVMGGLGLASIQVGIKNSIILYRENGDPKDDIKVLFNAKILRVLDTDLQKSEEGCFSLPEIFIPIRRYKKIEVNGLGNAGFNKTFIAEGMLANVLQHEIDHLNGMLMIDRLSKLRKNVFKKRLKGLKIDIKV